jgi:hypothetical protein
MLPVIEDLPEPVTVTRLPVGHPHTPADQVFQPPSQHFRDHWQEEKRLHLEFVHRERVLLNNLVHEGGTDPNKLVYIIDGWDSCKTVIPSYASTTLSRFPVGHTYTQLDQRFRAPSQHSHGEGAVDAPTPNEFTQELKESNSKAKADCGTRDEQTKH